MKNEQVIMSDTNSIEAINEFQSSVEKKKQEQQLKKQQEDLDNRMKQIETTMYSFAEKYGIEDYRTQLMIQFNDIALMMKEQVELISAVNTASEYIFETVGFFDESLNLMDSMFKGSLTEKYGPFYKLKTAIRNKRAIRNVSNRMAAMGKRMTQIQGISMTMVSSVEKATQKMQKTIEKNNAKRRKNIDSGKAAPEMLKSKSSDMVLEHLKNKSEYKENTNSNAGSGTGSFDDIL